MNIKNKKNNNQTSNDNNADKLKKEITKLLQKDSRGLTLTQLSQLTKFSTITVSKTLAELKGEGKIDVRRAGSAKLHYWRENN